MRLACYRTVQSTPSLSLVLKGKRGGIGRRIVLGIHFGAYYVFGGVDMAMLLYTIMMAYRYSTLTWGVSGC